MEICISIAPVLYCIVRMYFINDFLDYTDGKRVFFFGGGGTNRDFVLIFQKIFFKEIFKCVNVCGFR